MRHERARCTERHDNRAVRQQSTAIRVQRRVVGARDAIGIDRRIAMRSEQRSELGFVRRDDVCKRE